MLQDRRHGHVDTAGYLQMRWVDSRLSYRAHRRGQPTGADAAYGIPVDVSSIWTPDIELFNA